MLALEIAAVAVAGAAAGASNALAGAGSLITFPTLVALGIVFARPITHAIAPWFAGTPGKLELTTELTRIMLPFLGTVAASPDRWRLILLPSLGTPDLAAVRVQLPCEDADQGGLAAAVGAYQAQLHAGEESTEEEETPVKRP